MPLKNLMVVDRVGNGWTPAAESGFTVLPAREYLSRDLCTHLDGGARVINLCRSHAYQSVGYYVSLLAEARGHLPIPAVATMRDLRSRSVVRVIGEPIEGLAKAALRQVEGDERSLRVAFGQTTEPGFEVLAKKLFQLFPTPLLDAQFVRRKGDWSLDRVRAVDPGRLDDSGKEALLESAAAFCRKRRSPAPRRQRFLYDLGVLSDPTESQPPSDRRALERFSAEAQSLGFYVESIRNEDQDRLAEFDALFIRETTAVEHPSFMLSRLAYAEGLAVIDDPWSILRCTNKIFLAEMLERARIPAIETRIYSREDLRALRLPALSFPVVLKRPDSAFSVGVVKVETAEAFTEAATRMLRDSELILVQTFVPSDFDWRIGVLDNQPLFACKYFMATDHWQIYNWSAHSTDDRSGRVETLPVESVPEFVLKPALKAARMIGDGLYGIDVKQIGNQALIVEVNDNPSIDADLEDKILGGELYRRIARSFIRRIESLKGIHDRR